MNKNGWQTVGNVSMDRYQDEMRISVASAYLDATSFVLDADFPQHMPMCTRIVQNFELNTWQNEEKTLLVRLNR